jgi:hypothetical protein
MDLRRPQVNAPAASVVTGLTDAPNASTPIGWLGMLFSPAPLSYAADWE